MPDQIKDNEITELISSFKETGQVPNQLLISFDQKGHWRHKFYSCQRLNEVFSEIQLRNDQIANKDENGGIHLRTSLHQVWYPSVAGKCPTARISYTSVAGNCEIGTIGPIELEHLKSVGGTLDGRGAAALYAPKLEFIGANLWLGKAKKVVLPRISSLGKNLGNVKPYLDLEALSYSDPKETRELLCLLKRKNALIFHNLNITDTPTSKIYKSLLAQEKILNKLKADQLDLN